jgi:hypothetical protein
MVKGMFPILLLCFSISVSGLTVAAVYFNKALGNLHSTLDTLQLKVDIDPYTKTISLGVFIVFPIAVVYMILCILIKLRRNYIFIASANILGWLVLSAIVMYIAFISVWTAGIYIAFLGSTQVVNTVQPYWTKVTVIYNNTIAKVNDIPVLDTITSSINGTQINTPIGNINLNGILNQIPIPIGNNNINSTQIVTKIEDVINTIKNTVNGTCPIVCLDLNGVSWLQPGNNCICNLTRLEQAEQYLNSGWYNFAITIVGSALMYIGLSWLLMYSSSCYTARRIKRKLAILP